jgi:hypothetical protein
MNYSEGSHKCNPIPHKDYGLDLIWANGLYYARTPNLFHTKWRSWESGLSRQKLIAPRVPQEYLNKQQNFHYGLPESDHWDYYSNGLKNRTKVR